MSPTGLRRELPKGPSEIRAFSGPRQSGPRNNPRLRLKGEAPITGYVDGAWWPHDDDLQMELRELLPVMAARLGAITRVTYHLAEWAKAPRRIVIDGRSVRLDGYNAQPANTLGILDAYRQHHRLAYRSGPHQA